MHSVSDRPLDSGCQLKLEQTHSASFSKGLNNQIKDEIAAKDELSGLQSLVFLGFSMNDIFKEQKQLLVLKAQIIYATTNSLTVVEEAKHASFALRKHLSTSL